MSMLNKILMVSFKDEELVQLLVKSMASIHQISPSNSKMGFPFEGVLEKIIERFKNLVLDRGDEIPKLRVYLMTMFKDKEFLAFGRVLTMLQDLFEYPTTRIVNYFKKLELRRQFNVESSSPWLDVQMTSKAIRDGLNPEKIRIFSHLSYKQKCLLRGLSSEQLNVMSYFSPGGIDIFSRITRLPREQRTMIFALELDEIISIRNLGLDNFLLLANLRHDERDIFFRLSMNNQWRLAENPEEASHFLRNRLDWMNLLDAMIRINGEEQWTLKELFHHNGGAFGSLLGSLNEEAVVLAEGLLVLSQPERDNYSHLDSGEFQVLYNLNEDQRNVIMGFQGEDPPLHEILDVAIGLTSAQRDLILSLSQEETSAITAEGYRAMLSQIKDISLHDPGMIRELCTLSDGEEEAILNLTQEQRSTLSTAYTLGRDGLFIIHELGPERTSQVFESFSEEKRANQNFTVLQMALMSKLENAFVDSLRTKLSQLFEITHLESQATLLNLSWRGKVLLMKMTDLDSKTLNILRRLSTSTEILTRNDQLTRKTILELGDLIEREGRVLINLNLKQRNYLSSKRYLDSLNPSLFNREEREVFGELSEMGRQVLSNIVLNVKDFNSFEDTASLTFLRSISNEQLNLFATLTSDEVFLLSTFMIWGHEEDAVFNLLGMDFNASREKRTEQIVEYLQKVDINHNSSKLIASTVEILRLTERIDDDLTGIIRSSIERIYGRDMSLIFSLQLLNLSMRDSKSLESLLVPQITGNELDIISISNATQIRNTEDVLFMRWILSQPPDLNGGIFYQLASTTLTDIVGDELEMMIRKSTSKQDGIEHERVIKGFRGILKAHRYSLTGKLFFTKIQSVISLLAEILTPQDCFEFLDSSYQGDPNNTSKNVIEASQFYNRGDPYPLLSVLNRVQIWDLISEHPLRLLELMVKNCRVDLLELFRHVGDVNKLIEDNRQSLINTLMQDVTRHEMDFYDVGNTLRYLAYPNTFVDRSQYINMVSEYVIFLQERIPREDVSNILDSFVTELIYRDDFVRSLNEWIVPELYEFLKDDGNRECKITRGKRHANMICVDSNNKNETISQEEKQSMGRTFDKVQSKNFEFYDILWEYSKRKFEGERVDPQFEKAIVSRIENVSLETFDPKIRKVIGEIRDNLGNQEGIHSILAQFGIANEISDVASAIGFAFTIHLVGKYLEDGDSENPGYRSSNLWVMPKIGNEIKEKLTYLGKTSRYTMAEGLARVIGIAVGNLAAFAGPGDSRMDWENTDLNIVTDDVFIAANVPILGTQIMSYLESEMTIMGELTSPIGLALAVGVVVTSHLITVALEVEEVAEHIKLSNQEELSLYWHFFWDSSIPKNWQLDIVAEGMYTRYLNNYIHSSKGKYNHIAISLPHFLITEKECIANTSPRFRRSVGCGVGCTLGEKNTTYMMDFSGKVVLRYPLPEHFNSRLMPETMEGYDMICGPSSNHASEENIEPDIPIPCSIDTVHHDTKWKVRTKELFIPLKNNDVCTNVALFKQHGTSNSTKIFFYLAQDATLVLPNTDSMDMMFRGGQLSITGQGTIGILEKIPENRYYFENQVNNCSILMRGHNFFYLGKGAFECDLGEKNNEQHNVVVIRKDFKDSNGINTIVGSENRERIIANFAEYIDGKGGGDIIEATELTVVKGYFDDFMIGRCSVLLPMKVNDIGAILITTRMSIHNKEGSSLVVDGNTSLITADRYLLTPIRYSNTTHKVTRAHIRKTLAEKIVLEKELATMRRINIPDCNLVKQLTSANYDIVLTELGRNIFFTDKNHQEFYWESSGDEKNIYMIRKSFINVTISKTNGIVDFQDLKMDFDPEKHFFHWNNKDEIEISIGSLRVILLPNRKNVAVTFDGKNYFNLENKKTLRDYCSHKFPIVGRLEIQISDLDGHFNCFEFDSNIIIFLKLQEDLILVSTGQMLILSKYYSLVQEELDELDLSLKLNNWIVDPETFKERANNPHKFVHYDVMDSGLEIYHNQPLSKRHIGVVDLKDKSIKDCEMMMKNRDLLLLYRNVTLVQVKNWEHHQPSRQMMFAFEDSFLANAGSIVSHRESNYIIREFEREQIGAIPLRPKRHSPKQQMLFGNNVNLGFVLFQHFLDKKYPLPKPRTTTLEETIPDVVNLVEEYEQLLNETARPFDMEVQIDSFKLYSTILELVKNENYHGIPQVLYSTAEEIYPRNEDFLNRLKIGLKIGSMK